MTLLRRPTGRTEEGDREGHGLIKRQEKSLKRESQKNQKWNWNWNWKK
jgi:hypothetical protein